MYYSQSVRMVLVIVLHFVKQCRLSHINEISKKDDAITDGQNHEINVVKNPKVLQIK